MKLTAFIILCTVIFIGGAWLQYISGVNIFDLDPNSALTGILIVVWFGSGAVPLLAVAFGLLLGFGSLHQHNQKSFSTGVKVAKKHYGHDTFYVISVTPKSGIELADYDVLGEVVDGDLWVNERVVGELNRSSDPFMYELSNLIGGTYDGAVIQGGKYDGWTYKRRGPLGGDVDGKGYPFTNPGNFAMIPPKGEKFSWHEPYGRDSNGPISWDGQS
jgi:hypothetical protein